MTPPPERPIVLFVCVHNAGRSQMAAALLQRISEGGVDVRSSRQRHLDWELDDPAGQPLEQVRLIRDEIAARVRVLADELSDAG